MEETKSPDSHAKMSLRCQLYREARAMAEYALSSGKTVPESAIKTIENFTFKDDAGVSDSTNIRPDIDISELVSAYNILIKIVEPAKPNTILLLSMEQKTKGLMNFFGPVPLVRQMMIVAILSLACFIALAMSEVVNKDGGNVMAQHGLDLLTNLLFYLAAAGMGASFAALYKANTYIANGTYNPTYHTSYWIRFFLGLIAGLILAIMISEENFTKSLGEEADFLENGIVRPLLAMLGGFSADLVYTVLNRLVETLQSLFTGSPKNQITEKKQAIQTGLKSEHSQQQMNMASSLIKLQQIINSGTTPEELNRRIDLIIKDTVPGIEIPFDTKIEEERT